MIFSIIIPVYNRQQTLPRLFQSLQAQAYRPLEIVLVDNGSTDMSLSLCQGFQKQYHQEDFQIIVAEEGKQRANAARNKGIRLSKGEYLYFFDSDDEIDPYFLRDALPYAGKAEMICASTRMIFPDGQEKLRACPRKNMLRGHLLAGTLSTQTMLLHRSIIERVGGWNEEVQQWGDWELGVRLLLTNPSIQWLPYRGYHRIYQHAESITREPLTSSGEKYFCVLRFVEKHLMAAPLPPAEKRKALWALSAKRLLLSVRAQKERQDDFAEELILRTTTDRTQRWIAWLHRKGMPAAWRLYYWLSFIQ